MELETAFYVIAIIFMIVGLALILAVAVVLLVLRKKVKDLERQIDKRVAMLRALTSTSIVAKLFRRIMR